MKEAPKPKNKKTGNGFKFNPYWIYGILFIVFLALNFLPRSAGISTHWNEVRNMIVQGDVKELKLINDRFLEVYISNEASEKEEYAKTRRKQDMFGQIEPNYSFEIEKNYFNEEVKELKKQLEDPNSLVIKYESHSDIFGQLFQWVFFIAIFLIFWNFAFRRMGGGGGGSGGGPNIFSIGRARAQVFDKDTTVNVSFKDVAGLEEAKEEVMEIVDFLKNPKKYTNLGGKIPKGALLVGPPGTGKTLLAKAVAGEAGVPFFSLSGSDFVEMFVGVGASRVRDLFKQAAAKSPSIIFIDEIDAIGRARGKNSMTGGNDERENTLNQLLTEMDGFGTDTNVIVLAATSRADVLDKALMRAGRFDRQIYVDLPDLNERRAIFEVHIKPLKLAKDVNLEFLAQQTPGFSGADIANVCNESALVAARKSKKSVNKQDFLDAVDRIVGGLEKKNKIITENEKKTIAFHEAGHATVSWFLEHAAPLVKVTIVPRGQSLGAAWYLPEERQIVKPEQILDEMCAALGGRAAEKVMFNNISTGALSDLEKVTKQARSMVTVYGLNDKIGNITYYDSSGQTDYNFSKPYSEHTAQVIDKEISKIIEKQYERAIDLLKNSKDKLKQLADRLLEKEVIFKDDLENILGKRPYKTNNEKIEEAKALKQKK